MVDQRGKDAPPLCYLSPDLNNYKYHALLSEVVWVPKKLVLDIRDGAVPFRKNDDDIVEVRADMGVYGFSTIEARDKFVRRANSAADTEERKVCFAVTLATGSVA